MLGITTTDVDGKKKDDTTDKDGEKKDDTTDNRDVIIIPGGSTDVVDPIYSEIAKKQIKMRRNLNKLDVFEA